MLPKIQAHDGRTGLRGEDGLGASPEQPPGLFLRAASPREHGDRYLSVRCRREEAPPTCSTPD